MFVYVNITHKVLQSPHSGPNLFKQVGGVARGGLIPSNLRELFGDGATFDDSACGLKKKWNSQ